MNNAQPKPSNIPTVLVCTIVPRALAIGTDTHNIYAAIRFLRLSEVLALPQLSGEVAS